MAKGKKKDEQTTAPAATKGQTSLDVKKARRAAQSKTDRTTALGLSGYAPGRRASGAPPSAYRCQVCQNPSARVRHQKGNICTRCNRKNDPNWITSHQSRLKHEAGVA